MTLKELQNLIDRANDTYYTDGDAIMEDARYDKLKEQLRELNPSDPRLSTVGASVRGSILQERKHTIPMGSLQKALNRAEFDAWLNNRVKDRSLALHASYKMDGGSLSLEYRDGKLIQAISRGDGVTGEDITANAMKFKGVPAIVDGGFSGFVRGEVVLTDEDWLAVDPDKLSNPRNLATGIARRKSGNESEFLSFYAFRAYTNDTEIGIEEDDISILMTKFGFDVAPWKIGFVEDVWGWYKDTQAIRSTLNYWIDGIVVKINDIKTQKSLGESSGCPTGQVAIKFEADGAVTTLRDVTIQVGCTGAIVPVANFDVARIGGTNITNATLCNWNNIETLGLCIGDDIRVIKAGDIIPRVMEVVKDGKNRKVIEKPTKCPTCGGEVGHKNNITGEDSAVIYCLNPVCPSITKGRIDRFLTSLDIKGIGKNLIESLVNDMGVSEPADLYLLHQHRDKMANLMLSGKTRLGEKRVDGVLAEIDKKRDLTISQLLGSLGIFGLGKRRVALIQAALPSKMDVLANWFDDTLVKNAKEAGVPNIAERIHRDLLSQEQSILKCIRNGVVLVEDKPKVKPQQTTGSNMYTICITGALSQPKKHFQDLIEKAGHVYTTSFSRAVTHLVAADPNSGSSKMKKAEAQGTQVISEADLIKLIS